MQITGSFTIPAPRRRVWEGLNDPEVLRQCIPGCEELTRLSDTEFEGKVVSKIGPVRASFTGRVTLSDLDPPNGYTIQGEGKGGVAGFAKGSAKVTLRDESAGTVLDYTADANVGGKLAQIGSRLVEAAAGSMAQDFFGRFAAAIGAAAPAAQAAETPPAPEQAATMEYAAVQKSSTRPPMAMIVAGSLIAIAIVIWLVAH